MSALEQISGFSGSGLRLFPVIPNDKRPAFKEWQNKATLDINKIAKYNIEHPNTNWGIPTGDIVVIDVDSDKGGTIPDIVKNNPTKTARTPHKGYHFYYSNPNKLPIKNSVGKLYPAVDVRSYGGYIVAPPSSLPDGNYEWENVGPIQPLPPELEELLVNNQRQGKKNSSNPHLIPSGERNNSLFSLAGKLRLSGLSEEEIYSTLSIINESRCNEPLGEDEIYNLAHSIGKYEQGGSDDELLTVEDALKPQNEPVYLLDGKIEEGTTSLLVGDWATKKTWTTLSLGVCLAAGKDWLGMKTVQCPVLYIDEESGKNRLLRRLNQVLKGENIVTNIPFFATSLKGYNLLKSTEIDRDRLLSLINKTKAKIMIIDALRDLMIGGDENSARDMQLVFRTLRGIANQANCAILVIHHFNKSKNYAGSTAIPANLDSMITINSEEGNPFVYFKSAKNRDGEPFLFTAKCNWEDEKFYMTTDVDALFDLSPVEEAILNYAKNHDNFYKPDLEKSISYNEKTIRNGLLKLVKDDLLNKLEPDKRNSPYRITDKGKSS
jgi:hypothetical protein